MSVIPGLARRIDEAADSLYWVDIEKNGHKSIKLYADYRDTNDGLLDIAYDNRNNPELLDCLYTEISNWYDDAVMETEDAILKKAGIPSELMPLSEDAWEYIRENYSILPPFDHFLSQSVRVNLLLDTANESNRDFVAVKEQYEALSGSMSPDDASEALAQDTSLSWLLKQQGFSMEDLKRTWHDYSEFFYGDDADRTDSLESRINRFNETHNKFLTSVCQELENMTNYMNTFTILAEVSMYDFANMMQPGKEIIFPKNTMVGYFCPWAGGGSVLEIELEKDLAVPSEFIWDAQVEGATMDAGQYSLDSVYGLVTNCWREPSQIKDVSAPVPAQNSKKPTLDSMLQKANAQCASQNESGQNLTIPSQEH